MIETSSIFNSSTWLCGIILGLSFWSRLWDYITAFEFGIVLFKRALTLNGMVFSHFKVLISCVVAMINFEIPFSSLYQTDSFCPKKKLFKFIFLITFRTEVCQNSCICIRDESSFIVNYCPLLSDSHKFIFYLFFFSDRKF